MIRKFENKSKEDMSKIKKDPPPKLISPPFYLLKLRHPRLK